MNESEVIDEMRRGNEKAFEEIFNKYKNMAARTAYLITGNASVIDDIVQESFIKCFEKIYSLKDNDNFKAWFFRILTRIAWKYAKRENYDDFEQISKIEYVERGFEKCEYEELYNAIEGLDEKAKTVLILRYFNDFSVKEIAQIIGCFEGTVKSRLFKARRKLKKILEKYP